MDRWIAKWGWHDRADARDQEAARRVEADAIERKRKLLERQRQIGAALQTAGTRYLNERMREGHTPIDNVRDCIAALKTGIDIERQAEDMPGWIMQVVNATDDELDAIELQVDRLATGQAGGADGADRAGTYPGEVAASDD
jgi:hypothetical protein